MADHQKLESLLRSIIADVQAMENERDPNTYGPFSEGFIDSSMDFHVEWPNLAILIREAEEALDDTSN